MGKKLLVIEDEKNISDIIVFNAKLAGYECEVAYDGEEGLKRALKGIYDLILLDLMLPKIDGFEICRHIRRQKINTPVIMVTAREEEVDKVLGLELGADDYITKPFGVKELLARIKANIRRSESDITNEQGGNVIKIQTIEIDCDNYNVTKNGVAIELSKLEYELLVFFAKNAGKKYSREELLSQVWKYDDFYGDPRTVDVTIRRLRTKIEDDPAMPKIIQNRRNVGYFLSEN